MSRLGHQALKKNVQMLQNTWQAEHFCWMWIRLLLTPDSEGLLPALFQWKPAVETGSYQPSTIINHNIYIYSILHPIKSHTNKPFAIKTIIISNNKPNHQPSSTIINHQPFIFHKPYIINHQPFLCQKNISWSMTEPVASLAQPLHHRCTPVAKPRDAAADAVGQSCGTALTVHVHRHKGLQGQRGTGASALTVAGNSLR